MLVAFACLAVLALQVSGLSPRQELDSYTVYAVFDNIGGLNPRSKVTIAGVTVGRVTSITLDRDYFQGLVEMELQGDLDTLTTDTTAAILTSGLLGEQYVGLITGADDVYLADGDLIEDTQSALVLEDMIGQFLFNSVNE